MVTGAKGFLGKHVCEELRGRGYLNIVECANSHTTIPYYIDSRTKVHHCDLKQKHSCNTLISHNTPDVVIHLAARVGGIGANQQSPGTFIYDNLLMGINLIDACKLSVEKFVLAGTVCSYPEYAQVPF